MGQKKQLILLLVLVTVGCVMLARRPLIRLAIGGFQTLKGKKTVEERVAEFGPAVRARLAADFKRIGLDYPPRRLKLVGLKHERRLEVWVAGEATPFVLLKTYPILAASGDIGPKLREGDRQVPEGVYAIESLNPNSLFHLSLRVNYPNEQDRARAQADGRTDLGGDIMIHGGTSSVGCLAMGDPAAEDLFILAADVGLPNTSVLLCPVDFRIRDLPADRPASPAWTAERYEKLRAELEALKASP